MVFRAKAFAYPLLTCIALAACAAGGGLSGDRGGHDSYLSLPSVGELRSLPPGKETFALVLIRPDRHLGGYYAIRGISAKHSPLTCDDHLYVAGLIKFKNEEKSTFLMNRVPPYTESLAVIRGTTVPIEHILDGVNGEVVDGDFILKDVTIVRLLKLRCNVY